MRITTTRPVLTAHVRLEALNSYEVEQKQVCEAEWARKAEEHVQLKAEQVQTRYIERMKQKLEGIARDRARFANWLTDEAARSPEHHRSRGVVLESGASDSSGDCPGRNRHVGTR
jgi:hypothetical protein